MDEETGHIVIRDHVLVYFFHHDQYGDDEDRHAGVRHDGVEIVRKQLADSHRERPEKRIEPRVANGGVNDHGRLGAVSPQRDGKVKRYQSQHGGRQ